MKYDPNEDYSDSVVFHKTDAVSHDNYVIVLLNLRCSGDAIVSGHVEFDVSSLHWHGIVTVWDGEGKTIPHIIEFADFEDVEKFVIETLLNWSY